MHRRSAVAVVVVLVAAGIGAVAGLAYAQQIFSGYYGYTPPRYPTANSFKGAFNMCRVQFTSNRREKRGWDTDYPGADINFSVRLGELTRTRVAKDQFDQQIGRVLPRETYPTVDLPMGHPIWHTQFELKHLPQMSSIQSWRRSGGGTTERGVSPGTQSARAVVDAKGRIMVVMIHNDDIPDGWERE